jgi:hypothetical protein
VKHHYRSSYSHVTQASTLAKAASSLAGLCHRPWPCSFAAALSRPPVLQEQPVRRFTLPTPSGVTPTASCTFVAVHHRQHDDRGFELVL